MENYPTWNLLCNTKRHIAKFDAVLLLSIVIISYNLFLQHFSWRWRKIFSGRKTFCRHNLTASSLASLYTFSYFLAFYLRHIVLYNDIQQKSLLLIYIYIYGTLFYCRKFFSVLCTWKEIFMVSSKCEKSNIFEF